MQTLLKFINTLRLDPTTKQQFSWYFRRNYKILRILSHTYKNYGNRKNYIWKFL